MKNDIETTFLGQGWSFPPVFIQNAAEVKMISNEADIHNSLLVLMSTRIGERIMQPSYGCNLDSLLFEPLTTTLATEMKDVITMAILNFESRIRPIDIIFNLIDTNGIIEIEIQYLVKATNSRYNLVYPFYINEANIKST
jgi:uncharacterized protein